MAKMREVKKTKKVLPAAPVTYYMGVPVTMCKMAKAPKTLTARDR